MGIAYNTSIVRDGLVLHLDAANVKSYPGSGTTWKDLSGNGTDGTLTNGPTFDSENKGSFSFDGTNDNVSLSSSSAIQNLTTNFTVSAVVKTSVSGGQYGIFTKGNNLGQGWTLYLRQGPQFSFIGYNTSGVSSGIITTPSGEISTNTWYFVTYTYDGSSVIGYVNSQQKVSITLSSFVFSSTGTTPIVGTDQTLAGAGIWNGNISQVSVYDRALTASEVQQNFNALRGRYGI